MNLRALAPALLVCLLAAGCSGDDPVLIVPDDAGADVHPVDVPAVDVPALDVPAMDLPPADAPALDVPAMDLPPVDAPAPDAGPPRCADDAFCRGHVEGEVCDAASGLCVRCLPSRDTCPAGQYCAAAMMACAPGCRDDASCNGAAADGGAGRPLRCDTATRQCVQCLVDDHCPAGTLCVGSLCVTGCTAARACPAGQTCCSGACVDPESSVAHCGACDRRCAVPNAAPACRNATCAVAACTAPFADCNASAADGCETDTLTSLAHCGGCGRACEARPHTTARCGGGACQYACEPGFEDCDGDPANGCETDTRTSAAHCGRCGAACALANATATCAAGACAVAACAANFGDCDGNAANGCETDTRSAVAHCGRCGGACPSAPHSVAVCAASACDALCTAGFADCDGVSTNGCETDTRTSAAHCGGCGRACATLNTTATCAASACVIGACAAGFADCDGAAATGCEADTRTSLAHCGACGRACTTGPNATPSCAAGACAAVCATNYGDCDGSVANGCETDLRTSPANCGACGRAGVEACDGVDNDCDGLNNEGFSASACFPLACSGAGLIQTIPDGCIDDGGSSAGGDSLQVYCVNGIARFCLSGEACPWRSGLSTSDAVTCSRSGLGSDFMARASCSPWNGRTNYSCDVAGRIFFP